MISRKLSEFFYKHYSLSEICVYTNMATLRCADYGFDCEFEAKGETESIIDEFGKHTESIHGIDYPKEALMQVIIRKRN